MNSHEIYRKIKVMRVLKGWSQEEAAERLGIAVSSYAKIERGETDIHISRLVQIAEMMEIDLSQLIELNSRNVINVLENGINYGKLLGIGGHDIFLTETQCAHELEKAHLLLQERDREIENLKQQIEQLREMNALLHSVVTKKDTI